MPTVYCFVVSIKAQPEWLKLSRATRTRCWDSARKIIAEFKNDVSFNYFDSDAFHAHMSDMIICETTNALRYHHLWDRLKDTSLFCDSYYSITDVRSGIKGVSHG